MTNPKSKIRLEKFGGTETDTANFPQSLKSDEWLEIGTIIAPQGLDGEVRVYPDSDFPERFEQPGVRWLLCPGEREPRAIELLGGAVCCWEGTVCSGIGWGGRS